MVWNKGKTYHTKAVKKNCIICGIEFYIKPSQLTRRNIKKRGGKYCSRKCSAIAMSKRMEGVNNYFYGKKYIGNKNGHWKGGNIEKKCIICGKSFNVIMARKEKKYCSLKCRGIGELGVNNISWKGGTSKILYPREFSDYLKEKIREKDNYRCQVCGVSQIECLRKLSIHHIDYDKKNNNINNLVSLCVGCHGKTTFDRTYWMNYFKNKKEENECHI
jgi:hypothetical protein